jgi:hypothetical protein
MVIPYLHLYLAILLIRAGDADDRKLNELPVIIGLLLTYLKTVFQWLTHLYQLIPFR